MLSAIISSVFSYPALQLALQPVHQWYVQPGPLVLRSAPLNSSTPMADRDRTVSRRSEPSSRTALIGEQPNPWDLLQPQDAMSRHRGAKPVRRCELLEPISLLSLAYLLSVERWQFHIQPSDHLGLLSHLLDLLVSKLTGLLPIRSTHGCQPCWAQLRAPPLPFGRKPPQPNWPARTVPRPANGIEVRLLIDKEWCFTFRLQHNRNRAFKVSHLR